MNRLGRQAIRREDFENSSLSSRHGNGATSAPDAIGPTRQGLMGHEENAGHPPRWFGSPGCRARNAGPELTGPCGDPRPGGEPGCQDDRPSSHPEEGRGHPARSSGERSAAAISGVQIGKIERRTIQSSKRRNDLRGIPQTKKMARSNGFRRESSGASGARGRMVGPRGTWCAYNWQAWALSQSWATTGRAAMSTWCPGSFDGRRYLYDEP